MNKKDIAFCSFLAGAAVVGGLAWLKTKIDEDRQESTITTDYLGNITDIHLRGEHCTKSFVKRKLPLEMNKAKILQEQNFCEHPDGVTMIIP